MLNLLPLLHATWQTIYMVFISSFLSIIIGTSFGILLFATNHHTLTPSKSANHIIGAIVNIIRSIPFIILMVAILPITRILVGTSIGTNAAIVPLTLAAIPFFARITESALNEVPTGLIEMSESLGSTRLQMIFKILLPESATRLIQGATLTMITLVGYSAMAGAIGGGGLGELAIDYGYQQFNLTVMIETVVILVVLVQIIQSAGNYFAKHRQFKWLAILAVILWIICIASQAWPTSKTEQTLKVGIVGSAQMQIMKTAKRVAEKDYNLNLKVILFDDYVLPNEALNNGDIDANIFQHVPYLKAQIAAHHYQLTPIAKTFVYPFGFYSKQIKKLSQLKYGAIVAIPNDPSNEGRALLLLQKAKLIRVKKSAGLFPTPNSVTYNPKGLKLKLLDAAQLPRVFKDATLVGLTNDYVKPAGFTVQQAVLAEGPDSPYANVIVVQTKDRNNPIFKTLTAVMHSKATIKTTNKLFQKGAAIKAWRYPA